MSIKKKPIPQRIYNASKDHPYVAGAGDIYDDAKGENQQSINADTYRKEETYSKEETNNIISRTPETDVVVLDVPEGSTALDVLDEVPVADRPNKLFRVRNNDNTSYSEYAYDGTNWVVLANKDYGIDNKPLDESDNTVKSGGVKAELNRIDNNTGVFNKHVDIEQSWTARAKGIKLYANCEYEISGTLNNLVSAGAISVRLVDSSYDPSDPEQSINDYTIVNLVFTHDTGLTVGTKKKIWENIECDLYTSWDNSVDNSADVSIYGSNNPVKLSKSVNAIFNSASMSLDSKILELDYRAIIEDNIGIYVGDTPIVDGSVVTNPGDDYNSVINSCTDYIKVEGGREIETLSYITSDDAKQGIAFYNADKQYISGYYRTTGTVDGTYVKLSVPANAHYARLSIATMDSEGHENGNRGKWFFRTTYSNYEKGELSLLKDKVFEYIGKGPTFLNPSKQTPINVGAIQYDLNWYRTPMVNVKKGDIITYKVLSRNRAEILGLYSALSFNVDYRVDAIFATKKEMLYSGTYIVPQDGYLVVSNLYEPTPEQYAYINKTANKILEDVSEKGVDDVGRHKPITSFTIDGDHIITLMSTHDNDATELDNEYIGWCSLITVRRNLFFLYYEATGRYDESKEHTTFPYHQSRLLFAFSTDGEHFIRRIPTLEDFENFPDKEEFLNKYPDGIPVPYPGTNILIDGNEVTENGIVYPKTTPDGHCAFMVDDGEYPFRIVTNVRAGQNTGAMNNNSYMAMVMLKSSDGINWMSIDGLYSVKDYTHFDTRVTPDSTELDVRCWATHSEVSERRYDTQYSCISKGKMIKVYHRLWEHYVNPEYERRWPSDDDPGYVHGSEDLTRRVIGVMYIDLNGNIISPGNILFGNYLYNPAAFSLDNNRELLLPTRFDENISPKEEAPCWIDPSDHSQGQEMQEVSTNWYEAFITDGDNVIRVDQDNTEMSKLMYNNSDRWGMVNPGLLLMDGDQYFTYMQENKWHDETVRSGAYQEIRRVPFRYIATGLGVNER